mgnify:CR=1 FL=1
MPLNPSDSGISSSARFSTASSASCDEFIIFSISFDLFTPPFDAVKQVSVLEIQEKASSSALRTGKRLGYSSGSNNSSSFINDDFNL